MLRPEWWPPLSPSGVPGAEGGDKAGAGLGPFCCSSQGPSTPGNLAAHRLQEALPDFCLALAQLRGSPATDYMQLGLPFKLQAWEVSLHWAHTGSWPLRGRACGASGRCSR